MKLYLLLVYNKHGLFLINFNKSYKMLVRTFNYNKKFDNENKLNFTYKWIALKLTTNKGGKNSTE